MQLAKIIQSPQLQYYQKVDDVSGGICVYQNQSFRWLAFNDVVQSMMNINRPHHLVLRHQYHMLLPLVYFSPVSIVELGLGGGSFQRFVAKLLPKADIVSIEASELVIELFYTFFNPFEHAGRVLKADAFAYSQQLSYRSVDWLIYDIYQQQDQSFVTIASKLAQLTDKVSQQGWLTCNLACATKQEVAILLEIFVCLFGKNVFIGQVTGFKNTIIHATQSSLKVSQRMTESPLTQLSNRRTQKIRQSFIKASEYLARS